jgi:hypothetical protein
LLRRPQQAGGFATYWHRHVDVDYVRDQVPGLVGGQVDTEELSRRSSPCAIRGSPSAKRCLSKETHDARKGFCGVDIHRVLVQSNLLRSLSQKQPQAAQPSHTCGKPPSFGIPLAGMPGWRLAHSDPSRAAAVEDSRTERVMASYRRLPSLAVNSDKSSRFPASTDDPDSFTNGASPLKWRPRVHHRQ